MHCRGGVPVFLPLKKLLVVTAKVMSAVYLRLLLVQLSCSSCKILLVLFLLLAES